MALRVVDQGDLPWLGEPIGVDEVIHPGKKNPKAGMGVIPADELLVRNAGDRGPR